jgi:hypothetical protein
MDTKGQYRRALLICISLIFHFTKHNGMCTLYQRQLSEDWDIHEKFFRQALKDLMKAKLIECVKPYDRKTQTGAVYRRDTGSIPGVLKQYPSGTKAVSPSAKVNNLNKKIKPQNGDFNQSPSVNENVPLYTKQTEEEIIRLKNKIK